MVPGSTGLRGSRDFEDGCDFIGSGHTGGMEGVACPFAKYDQQVEIRGHLLSVKNDREFYVIAWSKSILDRYA